MADGLRLSWSSIDFGLASGAVSVVSGIADHSLGVLAAGLSVLADVPGSVVLVWRFRVERADPGRGERVEDLAARAVALALALIAVVLVYESLRALLAGSRPGSSFISDPYGRILVQAPRDRPAVLVADLDLDQRRDWLELFPFLTTRRPDAYGTLT